MTNNVFENLKLDYRIIQLENTKLKKYSSPSFTETNEKLKYIFDQLSKKNCRTADFFKYKSDTFCAIEEYEDYIRHLSCLSNQQETVINLLIKTILENNNGNY